ncbi:MAG: sigma-70 family RNA polymerase sigma factor [bacterium]
MPSLTDEQLLMLIQNGSSSAFENLSRRYRDKIYSFSYRLLQNEHWAEDVVQETFLKIFQQAVNVKQSASFRAWIFAIARNEAFGILRERKLFDELHEESEECWGGETPLDRLEEKEEHVLLEKCIQSLKPEYREVILLREFEQLSYREIMEITGATESSVKSRLFKVRKALTKKLTPYYKV